MDDLQEQDIIKKEHQLHGLLKSYITDLVDLVHSNTSQRDQFEKSKLIFNKIIVTVNEFEPLPKLLDSHLGDYIETLTDLYLFLHIEEPEPVSSLSTPLSEDAIVDNELLLDARFRSENAAIFAPKIGEVIYNFSKIRGFKHITNYFSSDVYLIPRLMKLATALENDNELFLCLVWLSNLALVPFKLNHIDLNLTSQLIQVGIRNLAKHSNASKNQIVSLILLSRILTRSDVLNETDYLSNYFTTTVEPEWRSLDRVNGSVKLGHLITINKMLKKCPIEVVERFADIIYSLISIDLINLRFQQDSTSKHLNNLNVLYMIKILSKLSMVYVKQGNYAKSGDIISHLLNDIMNLMTTFDTTLRYAMAKSLAHLTTLLSSRAVNFQEQLVVYLIDQLNIRDFKIHQQLDYNVKNVFDADLKIISDEIFIPKYHTILLYVGFTSLEKSFPKNLIPSVFSIIHKTLFLEQRRLSTTLGSQVRDSSCFILWALCRLMNQSDFKRISTAGDYMMENLLFDVIILVITDDELLIRRCGVAVIQEFVGRFGEILFGEYINNDHTLGEFCIKLVELFNSPRFGSLSSSYELVHELVLLGFNKNLFVPKLLANILDENTKFETRKMSSFHLKLLIRTEAVDAIEFRVSHNPKTYDIDETLTMLKGGDLYPVSDFLTEDPEVNLVPIDENTCKFYFELLLDRTLGFTFDYHFDTHEKAESYLKWTTLKVSHGCSIDQDWPVLLNIMRLTSTNELIEGFKSIFNKLSQNNTSIGPTQVNDFQYYLKNNNIISSKVIFLYQNFSSDDLDKFISLLAAKEVDCDVRSNMIEGFSAHNKGITNHTAQIFVQLLDDYTITKHGDVGSKIRFSIINLIDANYEEFESLGLKDHISLKLVRLAGELIDKIRYKAMGLILKLENQYSEGIEKQSILQYFEQLFKYYEQSILNFYEKNSQYKELSLQFWKGVSFTAGALTANSQILNESFSQLLEFLSGCDAETQLLVFQNLTTLLKMSGDKETARQQKSYIVVLNVIVKLLESNFQFPSTFNFEALYIRCYNLQINTSNLVRIRLTIKILQHLSCLDQNVAIRNKGRQRVISMAFTHKLKQVRQMAGESIFEIINEAYPSDDKSTKIIESIDWEESPSKLKRFKESIENLLISI